MNSAEAELRRLLAQNEELSVLDDGGLGIQAAISPARASAPAQKQDAPWTQAERQFALEHLQPALERGEYVWYMAQVTVYMTGQTYTFDFVALRPDGGADHFEVKGEYKLGSEDRASVKTRWAAAHVRPSDQSPHRVLWAKKREGAWQIREIKLVRQVHPVCKS
jgi:hypothetical protein